MNQRHQPELAAEALAKFHILAFFKFEHLPKQLQEVSEPFAVLAMDVAIRGLVSSHPAEVVAGLRKLLEAKDCAVRSVLP